MSRKFDHLFILPPIVGRPSLSPSFFLSLFLVLRKLIGSLWTALFRFVFFDLIQLHDILGRFFMCFYVADRQSSQKESLTLARVKQRKFPTNSTQMIETKVRSGCLFMYFQRWSSSLGRNAQMRLKTEDRSRTLHWLFFIRWNRM